MKNFFTDTHQRANHKQVLKFKQQDECDFSTQQIVLSTFKI